MTLPVSRMPWNMPICHLAISNTPDGHFRRFSMSAGQHAAFGGLSALSPRYVHIQLPELRACEEADNTSQRHEESERQGAAAPHLPRGHEQSACDGAEHSTKEYG